ncbi:MAG: cytochrome c [Pedobacter sp.]|jgi:mono/diheme cytochrome c family protein
MKKNSFYTTLLLSSISIFILSASTNYNSSGSNAGEKRDTVKQERWTAPAAADSLKNPFTVSPEFISKGEELYNMYCFSCHGDTGYGDGPAGGSMGIRPANFHDQKVIKQKDGALYWKLTNGKGNMPPFKDALTEEQRWQLVSFLRELGKVE